MRPALHRPQRNRGARLRECDVAGGLRAVFLENELLPVGVLADRGTDVFELLYKPRRRGGADRRRVARPYRGRSPRTCERREDIVKTAIRVLRATTVTMPLETPLRHSNGAHWGRFVRTIVEVETDDGLVGLGELGGGGESARLAVEGLKSYLVGHDPADLTALWFKICNPTASLYNNRVQVHAAIEFACLDLLGQRLGVPIYELLGGKLRDEVPFASYLFFIELVPNTDFADPTVAITPPLTSGGVGSTPVCR